MYNLFFCLYIESFSLIYVPVRSAVIYLQPTLGPCIVQNCINRSSRRKRGMASNPLFIIPDFFCIFPMNFAMATLGLKEMGKFLWEGREKGLPCWLSQFSKTKLRQPTGQLFCFFPTFLREFSHFLQN